MKSRFLTLLCLLACSTVAMAADARKNLLFIAGKQSHGAGQHEHNAGLQLLAKCLKDSGADVDITVQLSGEWPSQEALGKADTIVIYADGGGGHPALQGDRLKQLDKEMKRGAGFLCIHYAVEPTLEKGNKEFIEWLGGCFETDWSVNPHWTANFKELPKHPISNGVKPFSSLDEWYFHMRFRPNLQRVTPILSDVPPASTMERKDGPHSGNPAVRAEVAAGKPQHVAWAAERENGGRGFGFTGGHFHKGWANDDQRKLVLNAILWTAKAEVPAEGVASKVTEEDLKANLDPKPGQGQAQKKTEPVKSASSNQGAKPLFSKDISKATGAVEVKVDLKGARELHLVAHEGPDGNYACDWVDWINPTLITKDGRKISLTSLKWKSATTGYGAVGVNLNCQGQPLKVDGLKLAEGEKLEGFGTHANSVISYDLPEGIERFEAKVGIDHGGTSQGQDNVATALVYTTAPQSLVGAAGKSGAEKAYGLEVAKVQMQDFTTPEGLEASLFAAEPHVQNPTSLDIDHRGRVWSLECVNYRSSFKTWGLLRKEGDRVVILEDSNGDGEADKETVFYQSKDLTNPLGILVLPQEKGTKVIVSASPNLWLLTDADGDDRAEKAQIIAKVGGNFDHDHNLHAVVFGPDGKFYFNFGNEGRELKTPDGKVMVDLLGNEITDKGKPYRQGMIFRCDIDLESGALTNLETLGHNFRNNYEVAVDSFGGMWQSDNDDDGNKGVRINAILDYGNYGYTDEMTGAGWKSARTNQEKDVPNMHWYQNDPGVVPNLILTGSGSPTGIVVNESPLLGKAFENQVIHCDAGPRTTRAYPVKKIGAGYTAEMVDILTAKDSWYRPADAAIAPDGSLFVSDWYDPGVGGHHMGDSKAESIRGRVYRVAPNGHAYKIKAPSFASVEDSVEALKSPNNVTRYIAWRKLMAAGDAAKPALAKLAGDQSAIFRARALHALIHLTGNFEKGLEQSLADAEENIRVMGVREFRLAAATGKLPVVLSTDAAGWVKKHSATEASKQVLREYALTLRVLKDGPTPVATVWLELASKHDGNDRWYLEALGIGAMGREDEIAGKWLASVGDKWDTAAGRDIVWRMRSPAVLDKLVQILTAKSAEADSLPRYLRSFDFIPASDARNEAVFQVAIKGTNNPTLTADAIKRVGNTPLKDKDEVKAAMSSMLAAVKGKPAFIEIVEDFKLPGKEAEVLEAALGDVKHPLAGQAVKKLLQKPQGRDLLVKALSSAQAAQATSLIGGSGDKTAVELLSGILQDGSKDAALRTTAVKALSLSAAGAKSLVDLAAADKFPVDLKAAAGSSLSMVQYPGISEQAAKLFPQPVAAGGKALPPIAELVKLKGDVANGKVVFGKAESTCILCHKAGDAGVDFGPGLSEIGGKLGKDALYESIISPNVGVSMGFETWQVNLKNGQMALGIVQSETNENLVIVMPGGVANTYAKKDIANRQKLPTSMMPTGLQMVFSQQDLVDLVEYLSSLKAAQPAK